MGQGDVSSQSCPISGFLIFALCLGLWGHGPWPGRFGASLLRTWSGHTSREGCSSCGAFLLAFLLELFRGAGWSVIPGGLCPEGVERLFPGAGRCALPALRALPAPAASRLLLPGDANMCGLVSESALHRVPSSGAWNSDLALWRALGGGAPGGSPPGFEGAPPQVFQSPFPTQTRGSFTTKSLGHMAAGNPPSGGQARGLDPGWALGAGRARLSVAVVAVRGSGVSH